MSLLIVLAQQYVTNGADRSEGMKDLRCMSFTSKAANEILVAGLQDQMFTIDINKGEITKTVPSLLAKYG